MLAFETDLTLTCKRNCPVYNQTLDIVSSQQILEVLAGTAEIEFLGQLKANDTLEHADELLQRYAGELIPYRIESLAAELQQETAALADRFESHDERNRWLTTWLTNRRVLTKLHDIQDMCGQPTVEEKKVSRDGRVYDLICGNSVVIAHKEKIDQQEPIPPLSPLSPSLEYMMKVIVKKELGAIEQRDRAPYQINGLRAQQSGQQFESLRTNPADTTEYPLRLTERDTTRPNIAVNEVQRALRASRSSIINWLNQGSLPGFFVQAPGKQRGRWYVYTDAAERGKATED